MISGWLYFPEWIIQFLLFAEAGCWPSLSCPWVLGPPHPTLIMQRTGWLVPTFLLQSPVTVFRVSAVIGTHWFQRSRYLQGIYIHVKLSIYLLDAGSSPFLLFSLLFFSSFRFQFLLLLQKSFFQQHKRVNSLRLVWVKNKNEFKKERERERERERETGPVSDMLSSLLP